MHLCCFKGFLGNKVRYFFFIFLLFLYFFYFLFFLFFIYLVGRTGRDEGCQLGDDPCPFLLH